MRFAILGSPIGHSRSPKMHTAAYRALGLPHTFEAFDVPEAELGDWVRKLREGTFEGMSVTIPHKKRVLLVADRVTPTAARIGAANTLSRTDEGVLAHNTDAPAIVHELTRLAGGEKPVQRRGLVLGHGGAALAAIEALAEMGAEGIEVRARAFADQTSARSFRDTVQARWSASRDGITLEATPWGPGGDRESTFGWVVQATSLGMPGRNDGDLAVEVLDWSRLPKDLVLLDAVYGTLTPFLARARTLGLRADDGARMLVEQGAIAFEGWLGMTPPRDAMLAALV